MSAGLWWVAVGVVLGSWLFVCWRAETREGGFCDRLLNACDWWQL